MKRSSLVLLLAVFVASITVFSGLVLTVNAPQKTSETVPRTENLAEADSDTTFEEEYEDGASTDIEEEYEDGTDSEGEGEGEGGTDEGLSDDSPADYGESSKPKKSNNSESQNNQESSASSESSSPTTASVSSTGSTSTQHVKDDTPKTADFPVNKSFILCGAVFMIGLAFIIVSRMRSESLALESIELEIAAREARRQFREEEL